MLVDLPFAIHYFHSRLFPAHIYSTTATTTTITTTVAIKQLNYTHTHTEQYAISRVELNYFHL